MPRPAPGEPLLLGVSLAEALSEPPAAVGEGPAESEGGEVALRAPEGVPPELTELVGEAESRAEEVGVASHPLALAATEADAGALRVGSKPLGVTMPLAVAAALALGAGDGEAPPVSEGGGERLSERLGMGVWEASALTVPHCEKVAKALSDGLCEEEREGGADGDGCPEAEAGAVMEAEWHAHILAGGERDGDPLPLPRSLSLGLPVTLVVGAPVLLPEALRMVEGEVRGEREGAGDAHGVAVAPFDGVPRLDSVSAGVDDALNSVLPDGAGEKDASCEGLEEGDAHCEPDGRPEALAPALGDVDPLSDAAGTDGAPTPLAVAHPEADGTMLQLAIALGVADSEPPPRGGRAAAGRAHSGAPPNRR